jgi:hypothetical protein
MGEELFILFNSKRFQKFLFSDKKHKLDKGDLSMGVEMEVESCGRARKRRKGSTSAKSTTAVPKILSSIMCSDKVKLGIFFSTLLLLLMGVVDAQFSGGGGGQHGFEGMCPVPECYCGMDERNRLEVDCSAGALNDIPTNRMAPHIEVIRITAPKDRANHLKIGRNFRQFRNLKELHIVKSFIS